MWKRFLLASALVGLGAATAAAQNHAPRTPSGKPDFSGNYDIATLTPFERSPERGEQLVLSPEDAARVEAGQAARVLAGDAQVDPDRPPPKKGAFVDEQSYNYAWFDPGTSMFRIDGEYRTSILTLPSNGRMPALTDSAKARRASLPRFIWPQDNGTAWWLETGDRPFDGPESMVLGVRCIYQPTASVPIRPLPYNNLKTIVQTDDHFVISIEWMHWARVVRLDAEHAPSEVRSLSGDSIGWWDGDTLVVETTNFLDSPGVARVDLKVTERFSPIDGQSLLYRFEVEDPEYTATYGGELPWPKTESRSFEYACHEGNYAMANQLRGARRLEQEWIAAGKPVKEPIP